MLLVYPLGKSVSFKVNKGLHSTDISLTDAKDTERKHSSHLHIPMQPVLFKKRIIWFHTLLFETMSAI